MAVTEPDVFFLCGVPHYEVREKRGRKYLVLTSKQWNPEPMHRGRKGRRSWRRGPSPQRIQRRRTKGWRMPEGAVYVGRPTKWGNAYRPDIWCMNPITLSDVKTNADAVEAFRAEHSSWNWDYLMRWVAPLRGHDLVCWCPLDQPCHADVLLALADVAGEVTV